MGTSEKFCLRWNDFESNISGAFQEIRAEKDFFDVTLACEDDQVEAHKVILSACSPFFKGVLRRNPHQHPLLYLKGIKHSEMMAVINFMYCGEVSVAQEDLNNFLSVAEELKIKGLTQGQQKTNESDIQQHSLRKESKPRKSFNPPNQSQFQSRPSNQSQHQVAKKYQSSVATPMTQNDDPDDIQEVVPVKSETIVDDGPSGGGGGDMLMYNDDNYAEYDEHYEGFDQQQYEGGLVASEDGNKALELLISENMTKVTGGWQCRICSKIDTKSHIVEHLESTHLEGVEYACQFCGVKKHSRTALRKHVAIHK